MLAAVLVYFTAGPPPGSATGYEIVGGQVFAVAPGDSQRDEQQLERLGGKAAVLTLEFQRWLGSLWQGQRLAWTLAVLSGAVAWLCFWIAGLMEEPVDDRDGTGR